MKVLVIGGGGREHALRWRLQRSPSVREVFQTNADYVQFAEAKGVDLTVVGPEMPLVAGVVDQFRARGLAIVGPTAQNAALEGSKIHAKRFMERLGIPTARFRAVANPTEAHEALSEFRLPVVFKTDGLAAGKGVIIAATHEDAAAAINSLPFPIVMEEFLQGEEVSFIVLCDGKRALPLEPSQDHKRVFDGDQGPNTGGMGAYSDSLILTAEQRGLVMDRIINPVVRATGFTGFLYAGLMMTADGPNVLEFNVRLGDPETQPLMMRLESDWGEVLLAAARGALGCDQLQWSPNPATCVVIASGGYPGQFRTGLKITGIEEVDTAVVFEAGVRREEGEAFTAGGRVLGVTASGRDLRESIDRAYAGVARIHFEGAHYRRDIGLRGLRRYNR